jgi:hypothetical protein
MRVVIASIHPISVHGAQILDLQLYQRFGKVGGVAKLHSERIYLQASGSLSSRESREIHTSFKLKLSAQDIHQQLNDRVHWCKCVREKDEPYYDRILFVETEGLIEGADVEHVELFQALAT